MAKSSIPAGSIVYDILADTRLFDATLAKLGQSSKLVVTFGQPDTKAFDQTIGKLGDRLEDVLKKVRPTVPPKILDPLDAQIKALENSVKTYRREFQSGFGEPSRREIDQLRQRMSGLITEANKLKIGLNDDSDQMARLAQVTAQATRSITVAEGGISRLGLASQVAAGVNLAGFNNTLGNGVLQLAQFQDGLRGAKEQGISPLVLGLGVAVGAVGVLGVGLGKVVDVAADFEDALTGAAATLEATQDEIGKLSDLARNLGPTLGFGPTQGAKAFEELGSAGLTATDVLEGAGEAALKLARATKIQGDTASEILGQARNAFNLQGREFVTTSDVITNAANKTILKAQDFRDVIGQGGAAAKIANQPFAEFAATIATTRNFFSSASDAGTSYKAFILALTPNSDAAAKAMKQLGFNAFDAAGNLKPIPVIVDQLKGSLAGLTQQQRLNLLEKIFGSDGARTAIALIESSGQKIRDLTADLSRSGSAAEQAAKRLDTFRGSQERLNSALEKIATSEGPTGFIGFLKGLNENLTDTLLGRVDNLASRLLGTYDALAKVNKELGTSFKEGDKSGQRVQQLREQINDLIKERELVRNAPAAGIIPGAREARIAELNRRIGELQKELIALQKTNQAPPKSNQAPPKSAGPKPLQVPPVPFLQSDTSGVSQAAINLALGYARAVEQAKTALEKATTAQERLNAAQRLQQAENNLDAFRARNQQAAKAVEIANTIIAAEKRQAEAEEKAAKERKEANDRAGQQAKKLKEDLLALNRAFQDQLKSGKLTVDQVQAYARRLADLSREAERLGIRQRPVIDALIDTGKEFVKAGNAAVQFKKDSDAAFTAADAAGRRRFQAGLAASQQPLNPVIDQVLRVQNLVDAGGASEGNLRRAIGAIDDLLGNAAQGLVKLDSGTKSFLENARQSFRSYLEGLDEAFQNSLQTLQDAFSRRFGDGTAFTVQAIKQSFGDGAEALQFFSEQLGLIPDELRDLIERAFPEVAAGAETVADAVQAAGDVLRARFGDGVLFTIKAIEQTEGPFTSYEDAVRTLIKVNALNGQTLEYVKARFLDTARTAQEAAQVVADAVAAAARAEGALATQGLIGADINTFLDEIEAGLNTVQDSETLQAQLESITDFLSLEDLPEKTRKRLEETRELIETVLGSGLSVSLGSGRNPESPLAAALKTLDEYGKEVQRLEQTEPDKPFQDQIDVLEKLAGRYPALAAEIQVLIDRYTKLQEAALLARDTVEFQSDNVLRVSTSDPLERARANLDLTQKEFQAGLATAEDLSLAYQQLIDEITASIDTLGTDPENAERVRQLKLEVEDLKKALAALNLGFGNKILGGGDGFTKGVRGNLPPIGLTDFQFDTDPLRQQFQGVTDAFLNGLRDGLSRGDLLGGFGQGLLNVAKIFGDALLEQASKLLASESFNALAGALKPTQSFNEPGKGLGGAVAGIGSLFTGPLGIGLGILGFALPLLGDLFKGPQKAPEPAARPFGGSATTEFNISISNTWQFDGGFDDPRARAVIDSGIESGVVNALKRVGIIGTDGKLNPGLKAVMA
jgi:TP901 family phage tail tape measure protein